MAKPKPKLATRAEAAQALGITGNKLSWLVDRGAPGPVPGQRGTARYDVDKIRAWLEERRARLSAKTYDLTLERARLARVQRRLTALKLREARGELIPAKEAEQGLRSIVAAVRSELLAMPRRAVLAGVPKEFEPELKRLVSEALRELARAKPMAAELEQSA